MSSDSASDLSSVSDDIEAAHQKNQWNQETENLVNDWITQTHEYEKIYEKSSRRNQVLYYLTIMPGMIFGAITVLISTVGAAVAGTVDNKFVSMSFAIAAAITACISTIFQGLHTILKKDKQAKKDHRIAKKFASLRTKLEVEMAKPADTRSDPVLFTYKYARKFNEYNERGEQTNKSAAKEVKQIMEKKTMSTRSVYKTVVGDKTQDELDAGKEQVMQDALARYEAERYHNSWMNDMRSGQ